jgi:hypothetical protein
LRAFFAFAVNFLPYFTVKFPFRFEKDHAPAIAPDLP